MAFWDKWFAPQRKMKAMQAEAAKKQDAAAAKASDEAALAKRVSEAALTPVQDSEAARLAAERRLRRMGQRRGLASTDVGGAGKALLG